MPTAVEDKDAIREVLAEYCFRLDNDRFADMAALFTEDGTWDTAFGKATGRAAIADLARSLRERAEQPRPQPAGGHADARHEHHVPQPERALDNKEEIDRRCGDRVEATVTTARLESTQRARPGQPPRSYRPR